MSAHTIVSSTEVQHFVSWLDNHFHQPVFPEGSQPVLAGNQRLPDVKQRMLVKIKGQHLTIERIFIELWWSDKTHHRFMAAAVLPDLVQKSTQSTLRFLKEAFDKLDNQLLTDFTAYHFAGIIKRNYILWLPLLDTLSKQQNIWVQRMVAVSMGLSSVSVPIAIPYFLIILRRMFGNPHLAVRQSIGWALSRMAEQWNEPVQSFIESYRDSSDMSFVKLVCGFALHLDSWIEELLRRWQTVADQQIRSSIENILFLRKLQE